MTGESAPQDLPRPLETILEEADFHVEGVQSVAQALIEEEAARIAGREGWFIHRGSLTPGKYAPQADQMEKRYLDGTLTVTVRALNLLGTPLQPNGAEPYNWGHVIIGEVHRIVTSAE